MNRNNLYGKKRSIPLSNKILMIASLVCVAAAIVVLCFFLTGIKKTKTIAIPISS